MLNFDVMIDKSKDLQKKFINDKVEKNRDALNDFIETIMYICLQILFRMLWQKQAGYLKRQEILVLQA